MRSDFEADSHKDPDQLEREVDEQRAHISDTLHALEQRFSPGQIFDQVLQYTRSNSGDFSRNLVDTVKNNPVPALLTATGLAWMMSGRGGPQPGAGHYGRGYAQSNASYGVDPAYQKGDGKAQKLKAKGGAMREGAQGATQNARERMHDMRDSARQGSQQAGERMHQARDNMRYQAERANQGLDYMLKEQPLALGAVGIALGALIGASLPRTQREDEALGPVRDRTAEKAKEAAGEGYERAREKGGQMAEEAKRTAQSNQQQSGRNQPH